jgi:MFS family permease
MKPGVQRYATLFVLAFLWMALSAIPLAIVCYVLLGALFELAGERKKAAGVALWAATSGLLVMSDVLLALALAAGAGMGVVLALAIQRNWSYGWQLTLLSGTGAAAMAGVILATWATLRKAFTVFSNDLIAHVQTLEGANTQWIELMRWWDLNYENVAFGSAFCSVLTLSALTVGLMERWRRDPEDRAKRKPTGFQKMRVPDWVVWMAIAAALMWFADGRWPNPVLRAISWNAALGLLGLYWLNGLSIVLYAMSIFKATLFGMFMVFSGMIIFGFWPMLSIIGFFDTWYDFRKRFRRIAILRSVSQRPEDQDF